jgi:hypothetical protein
MGAFNPGPNVKQKCDAESVPRCRHDKLSVGRPYEGESKVTLVAGGCLEKPSTMIGRHHNSRPKKALAIAGI